VRREERESATEAPSNGELNMSDDKDGRDRGRWTKGKSGNPKGRPKKAKQASTDDFGDALRKAMEAEISVNLGGKKTNMSRHEALAISFAADAVKATGRDKIRYVEAIIRLMRASPKPVSHEIEQFDWTEEEDRFFRELQAYDESLESGPHADIDDAEGEELYGDEGE